MDRKLRLPLGTSEYVTEPGLMEAALAASNRSLVKIIEHMDTISDYLPAEAFSDDSMHLVFQIRESCLLELSRRFGDVDALSVAKSQLSEVAHA